MYSSIPFLYEINTIMEWMTTKTVLRMDMWLTAEEIHHVLYGALYSVGLSGRREP